MAIDKYSAVWISHTSINDFLHCKRAYYLKNMYRDPKTNHKIKIMSPPLALGQAVHEVIESLSVLPVADRFKELLTEKYEKAWDKLKGKNGGFLDDATESRYKERGRDMITRIVQNPGPIARKAVKIKEDLPHYWLSEEDGIILCGKIDWLEYLPETDSVHIIDFKTGKNDESPDSLQLCIYYLLVKNTQHRTIAKASYWYIERNDDLTEMPLPQEKESNDKLMSIGLEIKLARQLNRFDCDREGGCEYCKPFEAVLRGEAEFVGVDGYGADVYIVDPSLRPLEDQSEIL